MGSIMRGIGRNGLVRNRPATSLERPNSGSPRHFIQNHFARTLAVAITAALLCAVFASPASAVTGYNSLDYPGAIATTAAGVFGSNVVGRYVDAGGTDHAFLYNGVTYSNIDVPGSSESFGQGINGSTIVGIFTDAGDPAGHLHGFIKNGASYTTLDHPLAPPGDPNADTAAYGVYGAITVGSYNPGVGITHGYTYDGSTYTNLPDHPLGTNSTQFEAIFNSTMVGTINGGSLPRGFIYNGSSFTTLDHPLGVNGTMAHGIYASNIVGEYTDASSVTRGYLYNGSTYTTLEVPLSTQTSANGIWGDTVVGTYTDTAGNAHGYITSIPEPGTLALAFMASLLATRRRGRRGKTE